MEMAEQRQRLIEALPSFISEVEKQARLAGQDPTTFVFENLGMSREVWRKIRGGHYNHPGFLKKAHDYAAQHNPTLSSAVLLPQMLDYLRGTLASNPYLRPSVEISSTAPGRYVLPYAPVRDFIGRKKVLSALQAFLFDKSAAVFYLYGPQGIGKSQVIRWWLADLRQKGVLQTRFPDGATLVNRHEPGEHRKDLGRTMTIILQNLFLYHPPQGDPDVIAGDFHTYLDNRRILLAVDNVHGQIEAERFSQWAIPGIGKVVLTGMAPIDCHPDWRNYELGPFENAEVQAYLNQYYAKVADKVLKDTPLHGNRPKYVWKSACFHLNPGAHHCRDSREYFRSLPEEPAERRHVELLREDERDALCLLTVCGGRFDYRAAAAVLDKSEKAVEPFLAWLARLTWICRDSANMFAFHSVERALFTAVRPADREQLARLRYGKYLNQKLCELEQLFLVGSESSRKALEEFNCIRDDIFETFEYLSKLGQQNTEAASIARGFVSRAPNLLFLAFPYSRQKRWAESVQQTIGYEGDEYCQYHAKWYLNLYACLDHDFVEARRLASERVRIARQLEKRLLLVEALSDLGHAETRLNHMQTGGPCPVSGRFHEAEKLAQREGTRCLCHVNFRIGWAHMYASEHDKAAAYYARALQLAEEAGDLFAKGRTLINISRNLKQNRKLDEALEAAQEALEFASMVASNVLEELGNRNLAEIYTARGNRELAKPYRERWLKFQQSMGYPQTRSGRFAQVRPMSTNPGADRGRVSNLTWKNV